MLASSIRAEPATGTVRAKVTVLKKKLLGGAARSDDASGVIVYLIDYSEPASGGQRRDR